MALLSFTNMRKSLGIVSLGMSEDQVLSFIHGKLEISSKCQEEVLKMTLAFITVEPGGEVWTRNKNVEVISTQQASAMGKNVPQARGEHR